MTRIVRSAVGVVIAAAWWPVLASAQGVRAGVLTTVEGRVTATRTALREPVSLKFRDDVLLHDRVVTDERSLARMLLGGKAVVTVRERSAFTVTEVPGVSTVTLDAGKAAVAIARERMQPGERIQVRTPNAIVAVRGTVLVIEVLVPAGGSAADVESAVYVFRDTVEVTPLDPVTGAPSGPAVTLGPGQSFRAGHGQVIVGRFGPTGTRAILAGLRPRELQFRLPANAGELRARLRAITTDLLETLTGEGEESLTLAPVRRTADEAGPTPPDATIAPLIPSFVSELPPLTTTGPDVPDVSLSGATVALAAGQTLKGFSGASTRSLTSPVIQVTDSTVTKSASDPVVQVAAGASVALKSPLLVVDPSVVNTVNPSVNTVLTSVGLGTTPESIALTPDGARGYVGLNGSLSADLAVVSTSSLAVVATVALGPMAFVSGVAVAPDGKTAYALVSGISTTDVVVVDTATNTVTTRIPVSCCVNGIAITPGATRAYVADGEGGEVTVIDTVANTVLLSLSVPSASRVAVTPDGSFAYVTSDDTVTVISTVTNAIVASIAVGSSPQGIAISPDGARAYVANSGSDTVSVINLATNTVAQTIALAPGAQPRDVAVTPDGTRVYVTSVGTDTLSIIDTASQSVIVTIALGAGATPSGLAIAPDGRRVLVTRGGPANVAVIDGSPGASLLGIAAGGSLTTTSTEPLIRFVSSTATIGDALVELNGRPGAVATEVVDGVTLTLGTDRPLELAGSIVELAGSSIDARRGIVVDTALLAASAPLLNLTAGSSLTTFLAAVDLLQRARVTAVGPLLRLDASTLTVTAGSVVNVAGGSLLRVTGDLFGVANASTLRTLNGALLAVSGTSVVNVTGALATFGGTGNMISVANTLCSSACPTVSGIPVFFTNGASAANLVIGANPIRNPGLGTVTFENSRTAAIVVDGAGSKVTIVGD